MLFAKCYFNLIVCSLYTSGPCDQTSLLYWDLRPYSRKWLEGEHIVQESLPWINSQEYKLVFYIHSTLTQSSENDIWMSSRMLWFCNLCYSNHTVASFCICPGKNVLLAPDQSPKVRTKILISLVLYFMGNFFGGEVWGG